MRRKRLALVIVFLHIFFLWLWIRLYMIQIIKGEEYRDSAFRQRMESLPITISRGDFFDRYGKLLTNRYEKKQIILFPRQFKPGEKYIAYLVSFLGITREDMDKIILERVPVVLDKEVTSEQAAYLEKNHLPGVAIVDKPFRYSSTLATHLIGFVSPMEKKGSSGLEKRFDYFLRGEKYEKFVALIDAKKKLIAGLGYRYIKTKPRADSPANIKLSIDSRWQEAVERTMDRHVKKGAVVIMDPSNGDVLAMASRPTFDPNNPGKYLKASGSPLMNRAVKDFYPGSIFKLVIAAAALEEKMTSPLEMFHDPGYYQLSNLRFRCTALEEGGHKELSLVKAMAVSCNTVFIELGLRIGAKKITAYAEKFGFGEKSGIGLPEESTGYLERHPYMSAGDVCNISIGQKAVKATPLQIASFICAIANGGYMFRPNIVKQILTQEGKVRRDYENTRVGRVMSEKTAKLLKFMMRATVRNGTAQAADVDPGTSGKTGTAQTGRRDKDGREITHAWFAGFWPYMKPRIVMVILAEEGKAGGITAAPLFAEVINEYSKPYSRR